MSDAPANATAAPMHVCPDCGSLLVQPLSWEPHGDRAHWRVGRRCPECEWAGAGIHDVTEIDAFDEQLDLGSHELAGSLQALEYTNMREMTDVFVVALTRDLIGADDFAA